MEILQTARTLQGEELREFARRITENNAATDSLIVGLTKSKALSDCERIAEILSYATMDGSSDADFYTRAKNGKYYVDRYIKACASGGIKESEYLCALIYTSYAPKDSPLCGWTEAADEYLFALAQKNFDYAAACIDAFDPKYLKYGILIKANRPRALGLLLSKVLYQKFNDKSAIRDVLIDHTELIDDLFSLYGDGAALARDRAAIVRLLLLFRNDGRVSDFLADVAQNDKSKTVRDLLSSDAPGARISASRFFEDAMAAGTPIKFSQLKKLISGGKDGSRHKSKYRDIADRLFFCTAGPAKRIIVYNDGAFTYLSGESVSLKPADEVLVLHPLDIPEEETGLLAANISQPFPQLKRPVYTPTGREDIMSDRLLGTMIAKRAFDANLKREAFWVCSKRDDGEPDYVVRFLGGLCIAVECESSEADGTVSCGRLCFLRSADVVRIGHKIYVSSAVPLRISAVPVRLYSELIYSAYKLFGV